MLQRMFQINPVDRLYQLSGLFLHKKKFNYKDHQQSTHQTTKEADSQGETRESEEKSLDKTTVYSQGTDGTQTPYVSKENAPEVEGILVIADGGGNAVVAKNLTEAVQALFGVEAHKIKIMKRAPT